MAISEPAGLSLNVISQSDIMRLVRELEDADELIEQRALSKGVKSSVTLPRYSELLQEVADDASLTLTKRSDRAALSKYLVAIRDTAPVLHLDFAKIMPVQSLRPLVAWFRKEIDNNVLLEIRLRPSLVAGCAVRSTNKYFDYSLRPKIDTARAPLRAAIKTGVARV